MTKTRRYFVEQLRRYEQIDCYWADGRLHTRAVHSKLAMYPLPGHAIFIGRYAYPFNPQFFLQDLDYALAKISGHVTGNPFRAALA